MSGRTYLGVAADGSNAIEHEHGAVGADDQHQRYLSRRDCSVIIGRLGGEGKFGVPVSTNGRCCSLAVDDLRGTMRIVKEQVHWMIGAAQSCD